MLFLLTKPRFRDFSGSLAGDNEDMRKKYDQATSLAVLGNNNISFVSLRERGRKRVTW